MTQPAPSLRSSSRDWNTCSGSRQTGAPARAAALAAARAQTGCEAPQHRPPGAHPFVVGEAVEATEKLRQAHGVSLGQSPKSQLKEASSSAEGGKKYLIAKQIFLLVEFSTNFISKKTVFLFVLDLQTISRSSGDSFKCLYGKSEE